MLDINYTLGTAYNRYRFQYLNELITIRQLTGYGYLDNRVALPKDCWIDVYIYAQSKVIYGNQINLPLFTTQVSAGKKIFHGKGNLSLTINDIFFTGIQRSEARYGYVSIDVRSRYDRRNLRSSISYSFGNTKVNVRGRSSGSVDEQCRSQRPVGVLSDDLVAW